MKSETVGRVILWVASGLIALVVILLLFLLQPYGQVAVVFQRSSWRSLDLPRPLNAVVMNSAAASIHRLRPKTRKASSSSSQRLFPSYHGDLPEKYKNLDAASSLVFWLGGMTDKDGKMIGFSADPKNPFDNTNESRIGPFFDFDPKQLRDEGGLPVYLASGNTSQSDPYVYFRPDSKGEYHGAWRNCQPCRDSVHGGWINSKSYQLFSPGLDGKYGSGVQYPSGEDYDASGWTT